MVYILTLLYYHDFNNQPKMLYRKDAYNIREFFVIFLIFLDQDIY